MKMIRISLASTQHKGIVDPVNNAKPNTPQCNADDTNKYNGGAFPVLPSCSRATRMGEATSAPNVARSTIYPARIQKKAQISNLLHTLCTMRRRHSRPPASKALLMRIHVPLLSSSRHTNKCGRNDEKRRNKFNNDERELINLTRPSHNKPNKLKQRKAYKSERSLSLLEKWVLMFLPYVLVMRVKHSKRACRITSTLTLVSLICTIAVALLTSSGSNAVAQATEALCA